MAALEVASQMSIKKFQLTNECTYMVLAMVLYSTICWCLLYLYKSQAIGIVQAIWSSISIVFSIMLGVMLFGDKVDRLDCIGVALIMFGSFIVLSRT
jgi:multidrug transporter EmrE-like cation transporter